MNYERVFSVRLYGDMYHTISKSVMEFVNENKQAEVDEDSTLLETGCRFANETVHTHPNFAGLSLEIPHWEKVQLLSRINNLIAKWVPHFANLEGISFTPTPNEENKIIRLNNSEHCVLFKFFFDGDNFSNMYQDAVKNLYFLYEANNEPKDEGGIFALCKAAPTDIITQGKVNFKHGYLIYVPGIVMGMTINILNDFIPIPYAECIADAEGAFELDNNDMIALLDRIKTGLIVEENYSPYITLGTSLEYKPAITEQIINAINQFLDAVKDKSGDEYMVYSAEENGNVSAVVPRYVFDILPIQKSDFAENPANLSQLIFATSNKVFQKNLQDLNFTYTPKQQVQLDFANTKVVVAGDLSLIYIQDLPMPNGIVANAYLMPVGGDIKQGHIRIFT